MTRRGCERKYVRCDACGSFRGMNGEDVAMTVARLEAEIEKRDEALSLALWALEDVGTKSAAFWYEDAITAIREIMGGKERGV